MRRSTSPTPSSSSGRRQERRWLRRSPAARGPPSCMPPSSPRCLSHRPVTPDRTGHPLRGSRGPATWSGRTGSSARPGIPPTCAAGWAPPRWRGTLPAAPAGRAGATSSRLGFLAGTGRNSPCSSRLSMRAPGNRWCSTGTAGSTWWTPSPRAPRRCCRTGSARTDTSTAAIDAARTPTWRPAAGGCSCCHRSAAGRACRSGGAWTWQPRSTSSAPAAAGSRRCSRTAARATSSTPTRWTPRRACRPREEATNKAAASPNHSPSCGA
jgi:hypothetical protein